MGQLPIGDLAIVAAVVIWVGVMLAAQDGAEADSPHGIALAEDGLPPVSYARDGARMAWWTAELTALRVAVGVAGGPSARLVATASDRLEGVDAFVRCGARHRFALRAPRSFAAQDSDGFSRSRSRDICASRSAAPHAWCTRRIRPIVSQSRRRSTIRGCSSRDVGITTST